MTQTDQLSFLHDAEFRRYLQEIRESDNRTNWLYIARSWLLLTVILSAAVVGLEWIAETGTHWAWAIPIVLASAVFVGAGQHHLGVLGHEGSHRTLFRNRWLNELASDWLCMYPLFTTTYMYRLQHLAHHQFVNDPDRDPNVVQMRATKTWPEGPLRPRQIVTYLVGLINPLRLLGFLRERIQDNAFSSSHDVYRCSTPAAPSWPKKLGALVVVGQFGLNIALYYSGNELLLAILPAGLWLGSILFFGMMPGRLYHSSRVKPDIGLRTTTLMRFTCYYALFNGLAWIGIWTKSPAIIYWMLLWVIPLLTTFPLYVLLRQFVQHGNGGRGRLSNTRVFLRPAFMNAFLLPIGQNYHLPHHLFASVPHYRLLELHRRMCQFTDYAAIAIEVDGLIHRPRPPRKNLVEVLGDPSREAEAKFIDPSVLDEHDVDEREQIRAEEAASAR